MIDDDLRQLNAQPADRDLGRLEADIWAGLAQRSRHRAVTRGRVLLQSAVMALSLFVSIAIGVHATREEGASHVVAVVASGLDLAPSSLLLGGAR